MTQDNRAIKRNFNRQTLRKRCFTVFILFISLYFGVCFSQDQTQISIDLNVCEPDKHHLAWGLGSEATEVLGIEVLEAPGFVPEQACSIEHMTEVEGGYMITTCIFPSSYQTLSIKQEFDVYLGTKPLTAYEAIRYCKLVKAGNFLLEQMIESESSE